MAAYILRPAQQLALPPRIFSPSVVESTLHIIVLHMISQHLSPALGLTRLVGRAWDQYRSSLAHDAHRSSNSPASEQPHTSQPMSGDP